MGSTIRGIVLALAFGAALSGVAWATPQAHAPAAQLTNAFGVQRQRPPLFEQHTCSAARPPAASPRAPQPPDDWRLLFAQLLGVYALSFGLVRGLFSPAATRPVSSLP